MSDRAALIWCPFADEDSGKKAAAQLLEERLIACANIVPAIQSAFVWQGVTDTGEEVGALFKTTSARMDEAMTRLDAIHPYEQPAITGWTVRASPSTLAWLEAETREG